jgi:phenylalanine-4-hydroxylase
MEDWIIPQDWARFSTEEHGLWDQLHARQRALLPGRAATAFLDGLERLDLGSGGIPEFGALSARLQALTGWRVVAVPGLVPDDVFFRMLSQRIFPAGNFIRRPEQIDYLEAPDVFHDVFGHVPMLSHPVFADYMQAYGEGGLRAEGLGVLPALARLYWYTVEFGLVVEAGALRIYGAGIVSSASETRFALESSSPHRIGFDLERLMRTRYRIDAFQQVYFVIESFEQLLATTLETDFAPLYARLGEQPELAPDDVVAADHVWSRGSQQAA